MCEAGMCEAEMRGAKMCREKMRNVLLVLLVVLPAMTLAPAQGRKPDEGWSDLLPQGDGREMVLNSCVSCHNVRVVVHARKNRADWTKCINDMIQRGAPLFPDEIEPITAYLAKAFDTTTPKLVNVNTASREELEKLPNMKPEIATRILAAREKAGAFKNGEELRTALAMTKADFEKILYLLKYKE